MEILSTLKDLCKGVHPLLTGGFPSQRAAIRGIYLMFVWRNFYTNSRVAGDLRHHDAHATSLLYICSERQSHVEKSKYPLFQIAAIKHWGTTNMSSIIKNTCVTSYSKKTTNYCMLYNVLQNIAFNSKLLPSFRLSQIEYCWRVHRIPFKVHQG